MKLQRFKNYGFWVSLLALIGMLLQDFGGVNITPTQFDLYSEAILTILVFLGIANDPTTGKWYKDNK